MRPVTVTTRVVGVDVGVVVAVCVGVAGGVFVAVGGGVFVAVCGSGVEVGVGDPGGTAPPLITGGDG